MRTALAVLATAVLTLALAAGLGIEPSNEEADQRPPLVQTRPISEPVGVDGLPNLGTLPVVTRRHRP